MVTLLTLDNLYCLYTEQILSIPLPLARHLSVYRLPGVRSFQRRSLQECLDTHLLSQLDPLDSTFVLELCVCHHSNEAIDRSLKHFYFTRNKIHYFLLSLFV